MAIMVTGGTGVAPRDRTVEVVRRLLTIELEGFGELFRMLSYRQIGAAAMLSRAVGGLIAAPESGCESLVFAMPGSSNAVRLAMTELILPQLPHLAYLRSAHPQTSSERASPPSGSDH
jgi:molybdenum cofactor biosynthesis protein B